MKTEKLTCRQINRLDIVDYLEKLGFKPQKIRGDDYWYLSPLRDEKTPSFKVSKKLNAWYDHGIGKGGNLVDFGALYYQCTVKDLLHRLSDSSHSIFSFHPRQKTNADEKKDLFTKGGNITIIAIRKISDPNLRAYIHKRQIPLPVANQFCDEIVFEINRKRHLTIGFKNNAGGWELRNEYYKGCISPKGPSLIQENSCRDLLVFEGFFDFLSFQTLQQSNVNNGIKLPNVHGSCLVLNSLSFFEKSRNIMESYKAIHLFLDCDKMGMFWTEQALKWSPAYHNQSEFYSEYKDLNECLVKSIKHELKQSRNKGMRL